MQHPPFNLKGTNNKIEVANIIAALCCQEILVERLDGAGTWQTVLKNVVPQGAPTSPTLTNIICQSLDFYLGAAAKKFGVKYSRYADDITFSSSHNIYKENSEFVAEIKRIITNQNFNIKDSKTRLQKAGFKQEVTGLLVNEKPNVHKRYIKELRKWLYYWEHYGYATANDYFIPHYIADKGDKNQQPNLKNVLGGKLDF
ncbi:reverse transcriptase family protein [Mucilaginibacter antarcticus]